MTGAERHSSRWGGPPACALVLLMCAMAAGPVRAAGGAGTPNALDDAISLYRSAQYEQALTILEGLSKEDAAPAADDTVAEYRALCLLALDRGGDARAIVQALLERRPSYRASDTELPPRYLAMVTETRTRLWPSLVKAEYRAGKASYERKAYGEAVEHFRKVTTMLGDDSGVAPEVRDTLADVGDLARDFLTLAEKAGTDSAPSRASGDGSNNGTADRASPVAGAVAAPPAATGARAAAPLYTSDDPGVTPPVVLKQDLPAWRAEGAEGRLLRATRGVLAVVIDTSGRVESAHLETPLHPLYDGRLLAKTKDWAYRPAMREGVPVRFRKRIQVQLVNPGEGQAPEPR